MTRLSHIVAMAENRVIGRDGDLPWRISEDLRYFKRVTLGKPVIMGRTTHESIGFPLPGRLNLVLSRRPDFEAKGCEVFASVEGALTRARQENAEEVMVIGGEAVYRETLPLANRIYLTRVFGEIDGDVVYPDFDAAEWTESIVERGPLCDWVVLERQPA